MGTTAQKGQRVLQSIEEIQQGINNLGGNLTDQTPFKDFRAELDGIYGKLPKTAFQTDTDIVIENGLKGKLDFDEGKVGYGQTSQESTNGYQLLNYNSLRTPATNVGISVDENGVVSGGSADSRTWGYASCNWQMTLPAGTYRVSLWFIEQITSSSGYFNIYDSNDNTIITVGTAIRNVDSYTTTFTLSGETSIGIILKSFGSRYKIMLESGTTAHDWEKYSGGYSSPSPNWKQQVKCVAGRNKLDASTNTNGYVLSTTGELNQAEGYCVSDFIPVQPGATYNVSYKLLSSVQDANTTRVGLYDSSKTFISRPYSTNNPYIITIPSNCHYVRLSYQYPARSEMQLEQGTQATPYLPYNTLQIIDRGKNIFDAKTLLPTTQVKNDVTFTNNGDGTFNVSGTASASTNFTIVISSLFTKGRKYGIYCSKEYNNPLFNYTLQYVGNSTKYITPNTGTFEYEQKYTDVKLSLWIDSGVTISATNVKTMIYESDTIDTTYEPYHTPVSYQLSLGDRKIFEGDYLWIDKTSGKKYHHHKMRELLLADYNWSYDNSSGRMITGALSSIIAKTANNDTSANIKSNIGRARAVNYIITSTSESMIGVSSTGNVSYKSTNYTSQSDYETMFENINANAVIELATETDEEITGTLAEQLEAWYNAQSIKGTTIIESNGDLPLIIKVRALKGDA